VPDDLGQKLMARVGDGLHAPALSLDGPAGQTFL
jgi:hypothetical protein